jgi:indole-3-glycerol phosphate synthase
MNFLEKILSSTREEIRKKKSIFPEAELRKLVQAAPPPISLKSAIQKANGMAIIAEMKKASPSQGVICEKYDPHQIAVSYVRNRATALSVLTDEKFFQGSIDHISRIRSEIDIPILRKDFIIHPYQILEARAHGADAILLIVAALEAIQLQDLLNQAFDLGLEALVEVHNRRELQEALEMGAELIGINNRDLESFKVDLATTEKLAPLIPQGITVIAESGIHSADDAQRMKQAGADALLIGTHFMKYPSPGQALAAFQKELEKCFA